LVSEIAVLFVSGSSGNSSEFMTASFEEILFSVFIVQKQLIFPWNQQNRKWRQTEPSQYIR
jgi:hypothetical protein